MTPDLYLELAVLPALSVMPSAMDSAEARAMIVSIALQETQLSARRQAAGGPARSFAQFEKNGGIANVLDHPKTAAFARGFCALLNILPTRDAVYEAIEFNDVLCVGFTRLNLWTNASALCGIDEPARAWRLYLETWRPGRPRPETWNACYARAWAVVVPGLERSRPA